MERSLVIIKPDGTVRRSVSAAIVDALLSRGYRVRAFREMRVPESLAEMHYAVHRDKPFFTWLVDFITSAPVLVMVLEGDGVIQGVREALGATFVQKASPESLRGRYGIWAGINIAHASDGPRTAADEIALWTEQGGVQLTDDADERVRVYIRKYARGVDHTKKIRETVRAAIEHRDTSIGVLNTLVDLLSRDAEGIGESEIKSLAQTIFDFIKEEVEKATS